MTGPSCPSCGIAYADHLGLTGTCARLQAARKSADTAAELHHARDECERLEALLTDVSCRYNRAIDQKNEEISQLGAVDATERQAILAAGRAAERTEIIASIRQRAERREEQAAQSRRAGGNWESAELKATECHVIADMLAVVS